MELISTTEFVLNQCKIRDLDNYYDESDEYFNRCEKYANFISSKLELGMFIACDLEGIVLEEPKNFHAFFAGMSSQDFNFNIADCVNYKHALDKVVFDDFELDYDTIVYNKYFRIWFTEGKAYLNNTYTQLESVEDLISHSLELNSNGIKKLGL